ncbi:MAG TPA: capsule assembly Wzi family protein [Longimicrobiales bacterium]|nr:capsule assembly Wzi family protein [Longimicrobiales bacterium]
MATLIRTGLAVLALLACGSGVAAQQAPVFVEAGHWSREALRRLAVAGVAPPASDPAYAPVTRQHARAVFRFVQDSARAGHLAEMATQFDRLLAAEADSAGPLAAIRLSAGWAVARDEVLGGDGYYVGEDWEGAEAIADTNEPAVTVSAHGYVGDRVSWSADGGRLGGRWRAASAVVSASVGAFDAWAGRRPLDYSLGRGGSTVLGGGMSDVADLAFRTRYVLDGAGLHVREPFLIPFLGFLGPTRIEVVGGRLPRNGHVDRPYVVFGRLMGTPFSPRLTLGINRGAIFGGEGNPITAGRLLGLLAGIHGGNHGEFENQVISVLMRYRPPLGAFPVQAYVEWGMDDTSGAVKNMPAVIAGAELVSPPGAEPLALGLEYTRFPVSCCGNPIWYRSVFFRGSWGDEGRLFAHSLGGHGREVLAHARYDVPGRGLFVGGSAFARARGHENLFAPEREGRSWGGGVSLEYSDGRRGSVRLDGGLERGSTWTLARLTLMFRRTLLKAGQ